MVLGSYGVGLVENEKLGDLTGSDLLEDVVHRGNLLFGLGVGAVDEVEQAGRPA